MRTVVLVIALAIAALSSSGALAQESAAPARAAAAEDAGSAESAESAVSLFGPGTLSAVFAEQPVDTDWARATEARIAGEIEKQPWPGLTRAEVECRSSICALLLVYSGGGDVESELKESLRKALGFVGIRSARKTLPGSTISEVLFFR